MERVWVTETIEPEVKRKRAAQNKEEIRNEGEEMR